MINSLTKEQIAKFPEYVDKYLKIGLDTSRTNLNEIKSDIDWLYTDILKKKTVPIIIMRSPIEAWFATIYVAHLFGNKKVWSQVRSQVESQYKNLIWPYLDTQLWAGWLSFYDFISNELKLKLEPKYYKFRNLINVHMIYPLDEACIVSEKPTEIHLVNGRLHNPKGMSVKYADGFGVYSLNGVRVPEWLVMTPESRLTMEKFNELKDTDTRAEFIRKYGIDRMKSQGKIVDSHTKYDNEWYTKSQYELIDMAPIFKKVRYAPFLHMRNQTTETYHMEGVHPSCKTIQEAMKFRCGEEVEIVNIK